jgi:hypothetical protein
MCSTFIVTAHLHVSAPGDREHLLGTHSSIETSEIEAFAVARSCLVTTVVAGAIPCDDITDG